MKDSKGWPFAIGVLAACAMAFVGYAAGNHDGRAFNDDDWQSGYNFGWQDGCAHYYNVHGWSTGEGCGYPNEDQRLNATGNNQEER